MLRLFKLALQMQDAGLQPIALPLQELLGPLTRGHVPGHAAKAGEAQDVVIDRYAVELQADLPAAGALNAQVQP